MIVRICPKCNTENDAGELNCQKCGTNLIGEKMIYKLDQSEAASNDSNTQESGITTIRNEDPISQPSVIQSQAPVVLIMASLERKMKSSSSWFYWIAAMTVLNSVLVRISVDRTFIIGLGATIFIDIYSMNFAKEFPELSSIFLFLGIFLDFVAVGLFFLFGYFSRKSRLWAFIIGMVLYFLDSLIFLVLQDLFALLFHGIALYYLFIGLRAAQGLKKMDATTTVGMV